jgi:hypothetical protein
MVYGIWNIHINLTWNKERACTVPKGRSEFDSFDSFDTFDRGITVTVIPRCFIILDERIFDNPYRYRYRTGTTVHWHLILVA